MSAPCTAKGLTALQSNVGSAVSPGAVLSAARSTGALPAVWGPTVWALLHHLASIVDAHAHRTVSIPKPEIGSNAVAGHLAAAVVALASLLPCEPCLRHFTARMLHTATGVLVHTDSPCVLPCIPGNAQQYVWALHFSVTAATQGEAAAQRVPLTLLQRKTKAICTTPSATALLQVLLLIAAKVDATGCRSRAAAWRMFCDNAEAVLRSAQVLQCPVDMNVHSVFRGLCGAPLCTSSAGCSGVHKRNAPRKAAQPCTGVLQLDSKGRCVLAHSAQHALAPPHHDTVDAVLSVALATHPLSTTSMWLHAALHAYSRDALSPAAARAICSTANPQVKGTSGSSIHQE